MKNLKTIGFVIALPLISAGMIFGTMKLAGKFFASAESSDHVSCAAKGTNFEVVIQDNKMNPPHVDAHLCDTMTIKNVDDQARLIAFGVHSLHQTYDGVTEKSLKKDDSLTITFDKSGTYTFHDHFDDEVEGNFTVTQ